MALGSAAVLAVYTAGYMRTRTAAHQLAIQSDERGTAAAPRVVAAAHVEERSSVAEAAVGPVPDAVPLPKPKMEQIPAKETPPVSAVGPAAVETAAVHPAALQPAEPLPIVEEKKSTVAMLPALPPASPTPQWKDGTYYGWGTSRHGDIQAAVVIEAGRIASATIAQCLTRYSCSVIANLPPQVAQRQSPEVDYVSGATQSANAFYYAVSEALSKAR